MVTNWALKTYNKLQRAKAWLIPDRWDAYCSKLLFKHGILRLVWVYVYFEFRQLRYNLKQRHYG